MKRTNTSIENQKPNEMRRTNPIIDQAMAEIKEVIAEDGYASVADYQRLVEKFKLPDEILLPAMQHSGLGFVKTSAIINHPTMEVIVDLRYIAAAMMLVYSDDEWALSHSVLRYLEALHTAGSWRAAFPVMYHKGLLEDIYATYGHHFTDMEMADNAKLAVDDTVEVHAMAERHVHALNELAKSDAELTEVFHLCLRVMDIVNTTKLGKLNHSLSIFHRRFENVKAYKHFWRLAVNKILTPERPGRVLAINQASMNS
ncbi:hypothetical protein [Ralstonia phage RP31]|uniref:Uncharacterized protein n=2 Tax=Ripduovirus RP12 TaxID=2560700 RepID=A0A1L7N122_9CAUD|nr:hypothetical protein FDH28_gp216 [Ralstonia phage RP12]BAW19179.1 hypothetical protein [Ralstonia phage RP12]BAW19465.1 hypothetical protein [Ralstonia phage RP31]